MIENLTENLQVKHGEARSQPQQILTKSGNTRSGPLCGKLDPSNIFHITTIIDASPRPKPWPVPTMEIAVNELQYSLEQAEAYTKVEGYEPELLRAHAAAVQEDVLSLAKYKGQFGDKMQTYVQLIADATRVKRDCERYALVLEIEARKKAAAAPTAPPPPTPAVSNSSSRIPRIKLPIFDGESMADYRGFKQAFIETIQTEPDLSEVRKWLLLRAQLSGKALELVQELPMAPETYKAAESILDKAYGSTQRAIQKQYERLQHIDTAEMETDSLRVTYSKIDGVLTSLTSLGVEVNKESYLRQVVLSKFPEEAQHHIEVDDQMDLKKFREKMGAFIERRSCIVKPSSAAVKRSYVSDNNSSQNSTQHQPQSSSNESKGGAKSGSREKPRHNTANFTSVGGSSTSTLPPHQVKFSDINSAKKPRPRLHKCIFCSGDHWSDACSEVKTLDERRKLVSNRCQKCLRPAHDGTPCQNWNGCAHCKEQTHNRALCPLMFSETSKVLFTNLSDQSNRNKSSSSDFMTAKIIVGDADKSKQTTIRTVLDSAGGRTLITSDLVKHLGLKTSIRSARFTGIDEAPVGSSKWTTKLWLYPDRSSPIQIEAFVVQNIIEDIFATDVAEFKKRYPEHAHLPIPDDGNGERVQLLMGYKNMAKIVTLQDSIAVDTNLHLMGTKFGWIPFGGFPDEAETNPTSNPIFTFKDIDPVKLMSDLELVGLSDFLRSTNEEEMLTLEKFYDSLMQIQKSYQLNWPYKYDPPDLEENFGLAFGRLVHLWKQLRTTPELLIAYDGIIRNQLETDVAEVVNTRAKTKPGRVHYLPHRGIIRIGKSTPIRMVVDASAKSRKHAKSLNDNIMKGGNWVTELPGVLLRFRKHGVAVTSDIFKAFHQIMIAPEDRDVVRFLWLRDINKPPSADNLVIYRFKRMAFGVIASPFLLTATIKHHLRTNPNEFAAQIEHDLYADNLATSIPSQTDGNKFYNTIKEFFDSMGMNITQWATDSPELREIFSETDRVLKVHQTVLGVEWNTEKRTLKIRQPQFANFNELKITKRQALKEMAKTFDPLGWVAPTVLIAKLFIRKIWQEDYKWDVQLKPEYCTEWLKIREQLQDVGKIDLPRAYGVTGIENAKSIELHAFCDASAEAYGVAIYLCIHYENSSWSGLVAAKTRLAPKNQLSIPRLELLAAVTASKYMQYVHNELKFEKDCYKYLWGDSKCVIAWTTSRKVLPAFVDRAVKSIAEANFKNFMYVPTLENPADVASRGASIDELKQQNWWSGPKWLINEKDWPQQKISPEKTDAEVLENLQVEEQRILLTKEAVKLKNAVDPKSNQDSPFDLNPQDFQTFGQLLRRTAFCLKAASRFLRGRGTIQRITEIDCEPARLRWIRWDQQRIYEPVNQKPNVSYLRNLKIRIDEDNIIRCVTRVKWAQISREEAEPILLPKSTHLTRLIILTIHQNIYHAGTAHTLAELRKKYWLPHGRREVYQAIRSTCFKCRRADAQPFRTPHMADLPEFRINRTDRPFANVGVDVFGPYKIKTTFGNETKVVKYWVILFTCLVVRAVHLEFLKNMSAEEFLTTLRRFAGRRGVPNLIVSDNAPQFTVVEGIFQCLWRRFASADITTKYYAEHQIKWKFIPAHAPWMGGAYERMIQTIKKAFEKVYGSRTLSQDQFETAMIEVEAVINSRPITYVDRGIDTEIITPNDFLCTKYPAIPLDFNRTLTSNQLTEAWKQAETYLNEFWRIWSESYLREIRERREVIRSQQHSNDAAPLVGEIVLMVDPDQKRSSWRLAVVERLIPGDDGQVRSVQIRAANRARMIRPVSRLASLKLLMDLPDQIPQLNEQHTAIVVDSESGFIEA
ncbi:hypothetical protein V9T40_007709 [Parthenolecanium corni]|uniref:Integrase catalytic domain-containing protein n=1 Tax=Parthenolecanium corni TaxID=536013 RepID=A0AAN9TLT8_9HEMI